jgi:hypothetical protein
MAPKKTDAHGTLIDWVNLLNNQTSSPKTGHNLAHHWFDTDPDIIRTLLKWSISGILADRRVSQKSSEADLTVLDPFAGTGEVLKAARQTGVNAIGIDINPVAWFFAKTALEPVAAKLFQGAINNLAARTGISGRPLPEELYGDYHTDCPCENPHDEKANILKIFWIQTLVCSNPMCAKRVPLFDDFIISQKKITAPFFPDVRCPACNSVFDWDLKHASMISRAGLMVNGLSESSGQGRSQRRWAAGVAEAAGVAGAAEAAPVTCPHCQALVAPDVAGRATEIKKITISILYCPYCQEVWQYRGPLPENVRCPGCRSAYYPKKGNIQQPDWYQCPHCGTIDKISISLKELATEERFPVFPYAIEGFCPDCAKSDWHSCLIHQNHGYFFKKVSSNDLSHFLATTKIWSRQQNQLEFPISKIIFSRETQPLIAGNFFYWFQLFNQRQLLGLTRLLAAIRQEPDEPSRNQLLIAFLKVVEHNNLLVTFNRQQNKVTGLFDTEPLSIPYGYTESNILGFADEPGTFYYFLEQIKKQLKTSQMENQRESDLKESIWCSSLTSLVQQGFLPAVDLILTELPTSLDARFLNGSDFYYVWLRLALKDEYSFFSQEHVHRVENINYFPRRKDDVSLYFQRIRNTLHQSRGQLRPDSRMLLIVPQQPEKFWALLVETIFQAGLAIDFIIPVASQTTGKPPHTRLKKMIFGCRNLQEIKQNELPAWPEFVNLIFQKLKQTWLAEIQDAGVGNLPEIGQRYWLLGKVLAGIQPFVSSMLETKFPLTLAQLFHLINMLRDWVSHPDRNLPDELITMDCISYLYLAHFFDYLEITQAELDLMCTGICDAEILLENRILRRAQRKSEVNYIVIDPLDRYDYLQSKYQNIWQNIGVQTELFSTVEMPRLSAENILIDMVHLLLGKLAYGEDIQTWLTQYPLAHPKIRLVTQYLLAQPLAHRDLLTKLLTELPATA